MKNYCVIFCLCILQITSCTKTLYTQQQVLNTYKTKSDVTARFGLPSEVKTDEAKTTFYYYYGTKSDKITHTRLQSGDPFSKNNKRAFIDKLGSPLVADKPLAIKDSYITYFDKYMIFIFSDDNKVIGSEAKGIDLSVRAPDDVKTAALAVVVSSLPIVLTYVALVGSLNFSFHL